MGTSLISLGFDHTRQKSVRFIPGGVPLYTGNDRRVIPLDVVFRDFFLTSRLRGTTDIRIVSEGGTAASLSGRAGRIRTPLARSSAVTAARARRQPEPGYRRSRMPASIDLKYPFGGRWLVQNSPANRVPSHGTALFASSYAIDFLPVDDAGRTAPVVFRSLVGPESHVRFPGFARAARAGRRCRRSMRQLRQQYGTSPSRPGDR